jgi:AAA15 family ATPase/GTPase
MEVDIMPEIREEILLNCTPETAFQEVSSIDFARKIGFSPDMENEVLYQDKRIIKFNFKINVNNNIRSIESERIVIPENLTIITQRRNLLSSKYNVIIDYFKKHEAGTIMTHIDEFDDQSFNNNEVLSNMKKNTKTYMDKIASYFH